MHATRYFSSQERFSVNIWAVILHYYAFWYYDTQDRHSGAQYFNFHDETIEILLENMRLY
jgi:hypothetical protein